MGVIGPLIGAAGFFGVLGFGVGAAIGAAICRRAADPRRAGVIAAWVFGIGLAGGGIALGWAAAHFSPPDALNVAVAAFFAWMGVVNAVSGAVGIQVFAERAHGE